MTDIPHFAIPFRFSNGSAVVVEQDATDEIMGCVAAILLCPLGFRVEVPTFGIEDPTFTEGNVDAAAIELALSTWEPRAHEIVTTWPDAVDALMAHVYVRIDTPSED